MITRGSTVVAGASQVSSAVSEEAVILELEHGTYFGLDPVGSRVWSMIQEPRGVGEICDAIVREYEVEPDRCEEDVVELLGKLVESGLAEVVQ